MGPTPEDGSGSHILGCDYVSLPVDHLEEAVGFYRDVLGLKSVFIMARRWAEFEVGDSFLALYPEETNEGRAGEIAFLVEDLHGALSEFEAKGVEFPYGIEEFETPRGKGRLARFRDPCGNRMELLERY